MRVVTGRTDHIVVVGAGLGGLAAAMRLAGAGRQVTVVERERQPGGRAGRLTRDGFDFDTGPTVLTMPDLIADTFQAIGEEMSQWLTLTRLDPAYRAWFADGSKLDVIADPPRMAEEIAQVCGRREADGYLRFVEYARKLWELERADFIERNFDSPRDLLTANLLRLVAAGAFGRLQNRIDSFLKDERTRRVFSFQAMYAGLSPHKALAVYTVIAYLDSVAGVYFPQGGMHALPRAMAAAAEKHGVRLRYATEVLKVETNGDRATAVLTKDGERTPADVVILNPDTAAAHALLPGSAPRRRLRYAPSCMVMHVGSDTAYPHTSHHNIHFGRQWKRTFNEVITQGRLMSDPCLLVTNPSRTDPALAPPGRHSYYILAPVPNLVAGRQNWRDGMADRYADELIDVLEQRGYIGFKAGIHNREVISPLDWHDMGMAAGTPFAAAHTLTQSGPFRPRNIHPSLTNVVFVGSGTTPGVGVPMVLISGKLAAARVTGG